MDRRFVMIFIAGLLVFGASRASYAMMYGVDSHSSSHKGEAIAQPASEKAVNVGNEICPVSGEAITEETKATYEYKGKTYNFCCPMCIPSFKKDPEKYIKKLEAQKEAAGHEGHEHHR